MVNQVQTLRSATPGARPTTGARSPGELYVNWPDKQIGVVDAGKAPMDLLAVRHFSALATYSAGEIVLVGGTLYKCGTAGASPKPFDATEWDKLYTQSEVDALLALKQTIGTYAKYVVPPTTGPYVTVPDDIGALVLLNGVTDITLDATGIPNNSRIDVINYGTAAVTVGLAANNDIHSVGGLTKISASGGATLTYLNSLHWHLGGALE